MDESERMLELLNASFPDIAAMAPLDARAAVDARVRPVDNLDDVARAEDHLIVGTAGDVPVRVYHPHDPARDAPAVVFAHGGGFLHGSIASHDGFCRRWARGTGAVVVSVEYRLAPEHPAPEAVDDVISAVDWLRSSDAAGAGIVAAGDSSGANLAAVAAIALRDRGDSPLVGQVLIYPFLDPTMASQSYRTRAQGYFVTARSLGYYWKTYLGERLETAPADWRISPANAANHNALPPAIVVTAGLDPLCDEGRDYARLLRRAGVPALHRHHPEQFHGFLTIPGYGPAEAARELLWSDFRAAFVKEGRA
ncbi:alpha/beta hydrolase [Agromyces sp. NPDC058484]|uniref:alpha/beta hydrolase n=1 Tax=Agromyces sp. NPDC058484 TaxID=3346524 RepID=UPI00364E76E7